MGFDSIDFRGCCVGYGIKLYSFYVKTPYKFKTYHEDDDDDESNKDEDEEEEEEDDDWDNENNTEEDENDDKSDDLIAKEDEVNDKKDEEEDISGAKQAKVQIKEKFVSAKNGKKLLVDIKAEWSKYIKEFYPEMNRKLRLNWSIICPSYVGSYEPEGIPDDCILVWGYYMKLNEIASTESTNTEVWKMNYHFPKNSHEIIVDFFARFYHLKCKQNSTISENQLAAAKLMASNIIEKGIFGWVSP